MHAPSPPFSFLTIIARFGMSAQLCNMESGVNFSVIIFVEVAGLAFLERRCKVSRALRCIRVWVEKTTRDNKNKGLQKNKKKLEPERNLEKGYCAD